MTESKPRLLSANRLAVVAVALLNLSDAFATHLAISRMAGKEMNPLMDWVLTTSPLSFFLLKIGVSILFLSVMLKNIDHPIARSGIWVVLAVYMAVNVMHVVGFVLSPMLLGWIHV